MSHTRLCNGCGHAILEASIVEQAEHSGPVFQHWRRRVAASVGAAILDDSPARAYPQRP